MTSAIEIRNETNDDIAAIAEVTIAAFRNLEISNQTEHFIIDALRAAEALALSLVAVVDGRVVGHIAFSPVTLSDGARDWYGLGLVSVLPQVQRRVPDPIPSARRLCQALSRSACAAIE